MTKQTHKLVRELVSEVVTNLFGCKSISKGKVKYKKSTECVKMETDE